MVVGNDIWVGNGNFIRNFVHVDFNKWSLAEIVLSENLASKLRSLHFRVWELQYSNESDEECFYHIVEVVGTVKK